MKRIVVLLLLCCLAYPVCVTAQSPETEVIVDERSPEMATRLEQALTAKGDQYKPRTEHLLPDGSPRFTNRLILEDSPYLLQHAHNPVDWYAWSEEAFVKARSENKPVFLSIGYSTCHWCHVMERESFENLEIARFMNEHFVSIKVDRERRPDVDLTYMTAVQLLSGRGGWPMSSFLTPGGKTFFGGTYYPPGPFMQLLGAVASSWDDRQNDLLAQADLIGSEVQKTMQAGQEAQTIDESVIQSAVDQILARFDEAQGGFSAAPKFPNEPILFLLLDAAVRYGDPDALRVALFTLRKMAMGGIYDQIGGGFHRYATDPYWLVPHFEKMLYNQANLSRLYTQAHILTSDMTFARVARQTLDYVLREMTFAAGGFYSATDADSEGEEGRYFTWTIDQVRAILGADADFAVDVFGMSNTGNFEGRNILHLPVSINEYAENKGLPAPVALDKLDGISTRLHRARQERIPPLRDDKIVTAWNGMLITALAGAGEAFAEPRYLDAATRAAEFIWRDNRNGDDTLWRSNLAGRVSVPAGQEDYAYYAEALIKLYDVSGDQLWLDRAEKITRQMLALFWDQEQSGFYMNSGADGAPLMARPKETYDSATPAGNSVATRVLAQLAKRVADYTYENYATRTLAAFSGAITRQPAAVPYLVLAAGEHQYREVGPRQFAGRGNVVARGALTALDRNQLQLAIQVTIRPGWHINADRTLDPDLVPTRVAIGGAGQGWDPGGIEYPDAIIKTLGFSKSRLALFEGTIQLKASLQKKDTRHGEEYITIPVHLRLQACNDQTCLAPEEVTLNVPIPSPQTQPRSGRSSQ
jgi:hypothetical protein